MKYFSFAEKNELMNLVTKTKAVILCKGINYAINL